MAIIHPPAPAEGRDLAARNISEVLQAQTAGTTGLLKDLRTEDLSVSDPHRCYFISLEDLVAGRLLAAARPGSWRYLLIQEFNAVAEVELNGDDKGRKLEFSGLHQSPFAQATLVALRGAEELPQVKKQDYELRYLKIPSVYFAAVWLHAAKDDLLLPLSQPPKGLLENCPYSEKQVIKILQPLARQTKKFDDGFEKNQAKRMKP